jgi:hypothetical protein
MLSFAAAVAAEDDCDASDDVDNGGDVGCSNIRSSELLTVSDGTVSSPILFITSSNCCFLDRGGEGSCGGW